MQKVTIHTDGGCLGNPGPGGWAAVLRCGTAVKELSGSTPATTNNRMELQSAIEALRLLKRPCEIELFTDSQYLRQGITQWITNWKARGWTTTDKQPVKNVDLWKALDEAVRPHRITWRWLKGHAGHQDNERCDTLAGQAIATLRREYSREQLAAAKREMSQPRHATLL